MPGEKQKKEGLETHENVIFTCFGGFSNTGITAALASMEAVKELGLDKVCIGCLAALSTNVAPVYAKTKVAKKIITMDGCSKECTRKVVQNAGLEITKSFVLSRDIGMKKRAFSTDIGGNLMPVMEYISEQDVEKAKQLIVEVINSRPVQNDK